MGVENKTEFTRLYCDHLWNKHGCNIDNHVDVSFRKITQPKQLKQGLEGECITGRRRECPESHDCGEVIITHSHPPQFVHIQPKKVVLLLEADVGTSEKCKRLDEWFMSLRASLEGWGVTTFDGKPIEEMSWERNLK